MTAQWESDPAAEPIPRESPKFLLRELDEFLVTNVWPQVETRFGTCDVLGVQGTDGVTRALFTDRPVNLSVQLRRLNPVVGDRLRITFTGLDPNSSNPEHPRKIFDVAIQRAVNA